MNKFFGFAILLVSSASSALAQSELYNPTRSIKDQGISVFGWGSGTINETDELAYEGTNSIRVSTRNFFQGGIMTFKDVLNLSGASADPNNLLMLTVRVLDDKATMGTGGGSRGPGAGAAGSGSGTTGLGDDGGREGGGQPGGSRGNGGGQPTSTATVETPEFNMIRIIVGTSDNKNSEIYLPITTSRPNEKGWRQVGVPLQAITGFNATNKMVSRIAMSGSTTATFYVGEIKLMNDATPIFGEVITSDMNIGTDQVVPLQANGFAGATVLKYTWTITAGDGSKSEAEGQGVNRRFRVPGTYSVTCTIADVYGLKKPFTTNPIKIIVN